MKKQKLDWENLEFKVYPTRSMWKGECESGETWSKGELITYGTCLLYTSPSPRDKRQSRMPSSA